MYGFEEQLEKAKLGRKVKPADPFAPVRLVQLTANGSPIPRQAVMAEEDGQEIFIASHSDSYNLVHNELMLDVFVDALSRAGLKESQVAEVVWDGKRFAIRAYSEVEIEHEGDAIRLGVEAINSYDGSTLFGIRFFAMKVTCLNQFHFRNQLGGFAFRHQGSCVDFTDAVGQIKSGSERFIKLLPILRSLSAKGCGLDTLVSWHKKLTRAKPAWPTSKTGAVVERLATEETTQWGLLNAFTWVTSHELGGFSGSKYSELVCRIALGDS